MPDFSKELCRQAVKANINKEDWPMKWQEIPEGKIDEEIAPTRVLTDMEKDEGFYVQVFDTGKIVSGWPRISLPGSDLAGATIRMRYSEDLDESGRVKHHVANETSEHYYDQYTMKGLEWETWSPNFHEQQITVWSASQSNAAESQDEILGVENVQVNETAAVIDLSPREYVFHFTVI